METWFVSSRGQPGVSSVGRHGNGLGIWKHIYMENGIPNDEPDLIILGGWVIGFDLIARKKKAKIVSLICSSLGEMWLTPVEFSLLKHVLALPEIDMVLFGDQETQQAFKSEKTRYLPYPVNTAVAKEYLNKLKDGVLLFSPYTLKKNIANQVAAMKIIQKERDVTLHVNQPETAKLADFMGVKHQYHGWLDWPMYYLHLGSMQASLQVSFAESFNYQAIESSLLGVPPVTSPTIRWNVDALTVRDPNSPKNIAEVLELALSRGWSQLLKQRVDQLAATNNLLIKETLRSILGE